MNFTLNLGLHSSEKNHTTMTGGTLKVDKEVIFGEHAVTYIYAVELFSGDGYNDKDFHKGIHVIEHLLAYSKDTGSIRSSVSHGDKSFDGKWILDVSPCIISNGVYGFKITSLVPISREQLYQAITLSIHNATLYLESTSGNIQELETYQNIPFATPEQCGQYNYHCRDTALKLLKNNIFKNNSQISEKVLSDETQKILVCDLRLLKPKLEGRDDMTMFSPYVSYTISEAIEEKLPKILKRNTVIVGTFGCMTGMYLCVSALHGDQDEVGEILARIIGIISEMNLEGFSENEQQQIEQVLMNYRNNL